MASNNPMISASSAHADLGLITISPRATLPGCNILCPRTLEWIPAEQNIGDDCVLVFAGETLSFLTHGEVPAVLHYVPWIDRAGGPNRLSLPFHLRCRPDMTLMPRTGICDRENGCDQEIFPKTLKTLMEEDVSRRPWRGDAHCEY